ncbi:MAG: TPM domain-containing protein [Rhizobiaceae bacterium]
MSKVSEEQLHNVTAEDHERITAMIRKVEKKTSGEVYAVVAHQSDDYLFVAGFMAAFWALLFGVILAAASMVFDWEIAPLALAMAQIASFAAFMLLFKSIPSLRLLFVPRSIGYRRASQNAVRQFLAHGIHTTADRSGVLLFVSLAEHYAEVVADAGINEKVDQSEWDDMVATLTQHAAKGQVGEGFVVAIEKAGGLLAEHFPPQKGQVNELDDRLVEI